MAKSMMVSIGLMSGTSMDGIDAALIRTDGIGHIEPLAFHHVPYDNDFRSALRTGMNAAQHVDRPRRDIPPFALLERAVAQMHVDAIRQLLSKTIAPPVDVVGFHGQTLIHRPDARWTWQAGDAELLADQTGLTVVHDFRSADTAAGGNGAPLLPIYHAALTAKMTKPVAVLNLGGVGNVTYVDDNHHDHLLAFDTGPGNALIDDWMYARTQIPQDHDGATAARGRVQAGALAQLLSSPWFKAPPPKSLDRNTFPIAACSNLSLEDGAATLTAFTAESVKMSLPFLPKKPALWIVCGGGRHNKTLMRMLNECLGAPVESADQHGWNGDAIEAEGFAYMAVRTLKGLPISFPGTTGTPSPTVGGTILIPAALSEQSA